MGRVEGKKADGEKGAGTNEADSVIVKKRNISTVT